jgi:four helix bundle protein
VEQAMVTDFRELRVYQAAFKHAMVIFELSRSWPREERYSLIDQIRRSSRSVCGNIGEAWRKRRYPASFVSKLTDADAEAGETLVWLDFAKACGYLGEQEKADLIAAYGHICAQLVTMINQADTWCLLASQ